MMTLEKFKNLCDLKLDLRKNDTLSTQIASQIKLKIRDKVLVEGDVIPPIKDLESLYDLSNSVLKKAFDDLINERYIEAIENGYKVVRLQMMQGFLSGFYSVFDTFKKHGFTPTSEEISFQVVEKLPEEFEVLKHTVEGPFLYQRRLYKVNGHPLFLVDFYNLPKYFKGVSLPLNDIDFLDYFKKEIGIPMAHFSREIIALKPSVEEAKFLNIPERNAILGAKLINYDKDHNPLNFSIWQGSLKFSFWLSTPLKR
jgi:DNA-binding GntR family transcriptional regulator